MDGLLPAIRRARGSGLWKQEATALAMGGSVGGPKIDFYSFVVLTLGG